MANSENLIPQAHQLTVEEQSKGGKKSGETRRQRKSWKELLDKLGQLPVASKNNAQMMKSLGLTDEEINSDMAKMYRLDLAAQNGDVKALELQAKIRGEFSPVKNVNENHNIDYKPLIDLTKRRKNGAEDERP